MELNRTTNKSKAEFEKNIQQVFQDKIVKNLVDMNMAQLYSLGTTSTGQSLGLLKKLFSNEEISLLDQMHNEESLRDIENSIMMNQSNVQGLHHTNPIMRRQPSEGGLMDFKQIKSNISSEQQEDYQELKAKLQKYKKMCIEREGQLKVALEKNMKYKTEVKRLTDLQKKEAQTS